MYRQICILLPSILKNNGIKLTKTNAVLNDIINPAEQLEIIERYHTGKTNHRGINENYEHIRKTYYWPSLLDDVTKYINNCEVCQITKYDRDPQNRNFH